MNKKSATKVPPLQLHPPKDSKNSSLQQTNPIRLPTLAQGLQASTGISKPPIISAFSVPASKSDIHSGLLASSNSGGVAGSQQSTSISSSHQGKFPPEGKNTSDTHQSRFHSSNVSTTPAVVSNVPTSSSSFIGAHDPSVSSGVHSQLHSMLQPTQQHSSQNTQSSTTKQQNLSGEFLLLFVFLI